MRAQIRLVWIRLGVPSALSWINVAAILVLQVSGSAITSQVDFRGREPEFFALRVLSILTLVPVFWIGRLLLKRVTKPLLAPLITIGAFGFGLFLLTYVFDSALVLTGLTDGPELLTRLTKSTPGVFACLILTSLLVTYANDFSRKNASLLAVANELEQTRTETSQRILARQFELTDNIRTRINQEILKMDGADAMQDASLMSALIDDVVRPISYSLAQEVRPEEVVISEELTTEVDWLSVTRNALASNPFHPIYMPALMGVIGASFLVSTFKLNGALATLTLMLIFSGATSLFRIGWRYLPQTTSTLISSMIFITAISLVSAVLAPILTLITGFSFVETLRFEAWIVISNLAAWTVALVTSVNVMLKETNTALNSAVDDLKREVITLNGSYRQLQKGISRVLHGPVQSAIVSSLLKLQTSGDLTNHRELSQELRSKISQALDLLNEPAYPETDLRRVLTQLAELWSGAVEISSTFTEEDLDVLHEYQSTSYAVAEVVREICSNAIKHGKAKKIALNLHLNNEDRSFEIDALNDGSPLSAEPHSGLGSQLFDELALSWSRSQEAAGVRLVVRLPVN